MNAKYKNVLKQIFTLDFARWVTFEKTKQAQAERLLPPGLRTETLTAYVLLGQN